MENERLKIVGDLISPGDFVLLVVPIDTAAPKGRLILPQQQTIRDVLEAGAASVVVRESELAETLKQLGKQPSLVITDSQVFGPGFQDCTGGDAADLFFHPDGQIQGLSGRGGDRRAGHRKPAGRRQGSDFRGLYPSPAVVTISAP